MSRAELPPLPTPAHKFYLKTGRYNTFTADQMRAYAEQAIERSNKAAAWCDKHKPDSGARSVCVICSGMALSVALSRISYLCDEPNEMQCGPYDVHCDENAVVGQVERLTAELDALRKAP